MKPTDFACHLNSYISEHLAAQRNLSTNTIRSYRDTFLLLLRFVREVRRIKPEKLQLQDLNRDLITDFLSYLEKNRGCKTRTKNQRLAAIHSFFRYLQNRDSAYLLQAQQILSITGARCERKSISYLSVDEIKTILKQPEIKTKKGRRDATLLLVLYDTAARCQELIDIKIRDVHLESPAFIRLQGKGRKQRIVPLIADTVRAIRSYLREQKRSELSNGDESLFESRKGKEFSRSGIRSLLAKYVAKAKDQKPALARRVGPHVFRHSKAMHLLKAGVPIVIIRDILGHVDIKTTEIYSRSDLDSKRRALEQAAISTSSTYFWHKDANLMAWLRSL